MTTTSDKQPTKKRRLRRFNNGLSGLVLIVGIYLIVWPFLPKLDFWWKTTRHIDPPLVVAAKTNKPLIVVPVENTLVIPAIHLQNIIYDGLPYPALAKGVWHSPHSSTPDKGGNTVMAGHRFTYVGFQRGTSTFYNLDQVKTGDQIIVYWRGIRYEYRVFDSLVVPPTQTSIEAPTKQGQLTLYTCTPLWTSISRLVVQANLVK